MKIKHKFGVLGCTLLLMANLSWAGSSGDDVVGPFGISGFAVTGDTVIGKAAIDLLLTGFTGPQRHFSDVQLAVDALQAAYRERGFSLVKVQLPEQELNNGVIQLKVIQTPITSVKVIGNKAFDG